MNLETLQSICRSLPGVTEDVKWGHDLAFSIGGKMFCVVGLDETPTSASFKVRDEQFDELCSKPGFKPAPYVAKHKWVLVEDVSKVNKSEWMEFIKQSYELISKKLPAKLKKQLGI